MEKRTLRLGAIYGAMVVGAVALFLLIDAQGRTLSAAAQPATVKGPQPISSTSKVLFRFVGQPRLCNEIEGQAFQPDRASPMSINLVKRGQPGKADLQMRCKAASRR